MKKILLTLFATALIAGPSMTGDILLRFYRTKDTESRPRFSLYYQTEHFRVWYDTTGSDAVEDIDIDPANGMPDYVEKTAGYLEHAWQVECVELGFREPLPDSQTYASIDPFEDVGGDNRWDAYLTNLSGGFYGATIPDRSIDSAGHQYTTGYMKINGNMRSLYGYEDDPYPALAVTCAHEFQHMIQFHYRHGNDFVWQMEATATFMEEYVYDEVNDW